MYIIFNSDGSIKESQLNDYINQYSDGVNFIDVALSDTGANRYTASATFTLANGDTMTDTGVYKQQIQTSSGIYEGYRFTIHSAETQYSGPLAFSLVVNNLDETQMFTYKLELTVNPSAGKKTTAVTWDEYKSLLTALASYQLQYSPTNVRYYASETEATEDLGFLAVGQVVVVGQESDNTKADTYVVVSDTTATSKKKLVMVTLGASALKGDYVYKEESLGEVQAVHTGLVSHYTDKDDENIAVRYGTDEVDVPAWFCYCLDGDTYAGNITMGAKTFNFYDAHASDMPWLTNDGNITKMVSPSRTSKIEFETGSAKITSNNIYLGDYFSVTNSGASIEFTSKGSSNGVSVNAEAVTLEGVAKVDKDPTSDLQIASKHYVDEVASGSSYKNLNVENGTGSGSIKLKNADGASGENSIAFGYEATASARNSVAIGYQTSNAKQDSVAIGYSYGLNASDPWFFSVGYGQIARFSISSSQVRVFDCPFVCEDGATFNSGATIKGTLTAEKIVADEFTKVKAESVNTKRYTIGLAEGNTTKIASYIGLYATKYNGTDFGALVWDNTGTAYVGDASVDDNGVVTDPNKTLQPLMTRAESSYFEDGAILAWDADGMKAIPSAYFGHSNEFGNCSYINAPSGAFRVVAGDNGVFLIDDGSTAAIELDGKVHINRPTYIEEEIESDLNIASDKHLNVDVINSKTTGNSMLRSYYDTDKAYKTLVGSVNRQTTILGSTDRPYYAKDGETFQAHEIALEEELPLYVSEDGYVCVDYDKLPTRTA